LMVSSRRQIQGMGALVFNGRGVLLLVSVTRSKPRGI
jgi:hypothetical protein